MAKMDNNNTLQFTPKPDKIVETILYLAHKRSDLDQYQIVKLLYLADKEHLNRYGRPITFDVYRALSYGPVGSIALDFIKQNHSKRWCYHITSLPFDTELLGTVIYVREPRRSVNYNLFSKSDLRVLDEILQSHGDKTFNQLYMETRKHFAYQNAWKNGTKSEVINFEDMIEESPHKRGIIDELESVASHMK
jgi:uncharacterized phage-associated protein